MSSPAGVAAPVYGAVEAGEHELLIGGLTEQVHGALSAPVTALYPALAAS